MVLYSKHLTEEVLDAQPLALVLALLQGVLHSSRMVFKGSEELGQLGFI